MTNSIFVRKEDEKEQIEALKKSLRVYFEGDVDYNQRLNFVNYDISKDEDLIKILDAFDQRYSIEELENLISDIMITALNKDTKVVFVYDGKGKFTNSRKKSLENYPKNLKLGYPVDYWIEKCEEINEKSTSELPTALKDSLVDIVCSKNGYTVIRIMDKEFDWRKDRAMDRLTKIIENSKVGIFNL